jgi:hypothetical protein
MPSSISGLRQLGTGGNTVIPIGHGQQVAPSPQGHHLPRIAYNNMNNGDGGGDNNPWSGAFTKVGLGIMMVGISKKKKEWK